MDKDKILIYGFGISGISASKVLKALKINFDVFDNKNIEELEEKANKNNLSDINFINKIESLDFGKYKKVLKSPGIFLDDELLKQARMNNVDITNDIELAFRFWKKIYTIAITGTNGKTTTTTLIGEIIKKWKGSCIVTGNIGSGIMWDFYNSKDDDIAAIELSSFQLETIKDFRSNISIITNITPDHINWHGGYENYIDAKLKIFKNQTEEDICIVNYDNSILREKITKAKCQKFYFSTIDSNIKGIYVKDRKIYINVDIEKYLCDVEDIFIPGKHNLENALAAALAAYLAGVDVDIISTVLKSFRGVEHRLEYLGSAKGVIFYNDSKGTNTDATIKAVLSFDKPIHIIIGGYDKGEDFNELISCFENRIKSTCIIGQTTDIIVKTLEKNGYNNYYIAENLKEAVVKSFNIAKEGDIVLLSPACASWGMYKDYIARGLDFKEIVSELVEKHGE